MVDLKESPFRETQTAVGAKKIIFNQKGGGLQFFGAFRLLLPENPHPLGKFHDSPLIELYYL